MSDVLPSIDHARDRLLARIYHFSQNEEPSAVVEEDRAVLYAYSKCLLLIISSIRSLTFIIVLVTGQLSKEITSILQDIRDLFGILSEDVVQFV